MEHLLINNDVDWDYTDNYVNMLVNKATKLSHYENLDNKMKYFRELRDFKEYDENKLNKKEVKGILSSNLPLSAVNSFFQHIEFAKFTKDNLNWNLDEFRQGKLVYDMVKIKIS